MSDTSELNGPGPRHQEFLDFLGGLRADYEAGRIWGAKRNELWSRFLASQKTSPSAKDAVLGELTARMGPALNVDRLSPTEKMIAGQVMDTRTKPTTTALTPPQVAAIQALGVSGERKIAAARACLEGQKLQGSAREFDQKRRAQLQREWPTLVLDDAS